MGKYLYPRTIIRNNAALVFIEATDFRHLSGAEFYRRWDGNRDDWSLQINHVEGCMTVSPSFAESRVQQRLRNALIDHNTVIRGSRRVYCGCLGIVI